MGLLSEYEMERETQIATIADQLHKAEHPDGGVAECDIDWHTDTWFAHAATQVYNNGRRGN